MQFSRYVNLSFALAWVCFAVVLAKTTGLVFSALELTDTALLGEELTLSTVIGAGIAAAGTIYAWRHPGVQTWAGEIAVELSKVTWPGWNETKQNTMIVLVFSVIVAGILASFDFVWKWLTDLILLQ